MKLCALKTLFSGVFSCIKCVNIYTHINITVTTIHTVQQFLMTAIKAPHTYHDLFNQSPSVEFLVFHYFKQICRESFCTCLFARSVRNKHKF